MVIHAMDWSPGESGVIHAELRCLDDRPGDWLVKNDLARIDIAGRLRAKEIPLEEVMAQRCLRRLPLDRIERTIV